LSFESVLSLIVAYALLTSAIFLTATLITTIELTDVTAIMAPYAINGFGIVVGDRPTE